ncbi:MAG: RNA methyltransferase [Janthinobacterium lividum]
MRAGFTSTRFVLVEPSHPGNVGAAARALKNMGFGRLVLVRPRLPDPHLTEQAIAMASGATEVLEQTQVMDSLEAALAGTHWSVALSARVREIGPPALTPREAVPRLAAQAGTGDVALVFGNERSGLSNADVDRCGAIVHIPANPLYSSLNLAQAVQLLAYELRLALLDAAPAGPLSATPDLPAAAAADVGVPATNDEIEQMFGHFQSALIALDFLDPEHPKKLVPRLRRLCARAGLQREEVNILRGIARQILRKTRR